MITDEMGNQTTSGLVLEDEKPVTEVPEEGGFEAGGEDGEIPEDETETKPCSDNVVSDVAEKVQEIEQSEPEDLTDSDESANQEEEYSEKANGEFDLQIQEQCSIKTENDEQGSAVEESNPDDDHSTTESEEPQHLLNAEDKIADLIPEESVLVQDKPSESNVSSEILEPEQKQFVRAEEMNLAPDESENGENLPDSEKANKAILSDNESISSKQEEHNDIEQIIGGSEHHSTFEDAEDQDSLIKENLIINNESISPKQEEHTDDTHIPEENDHLITGGSEHHITSEDAQDQNNLNEENLNINTDVIHIPEEKDHLITGESEHHSTFEDAEDQDNNLDEESLNINSEAYETPQLLHLRKSPSFEFGIPLDSRSEESDQTPLLVRDKSLARSISGKEFRPTMMPPDYSYVAEKTIRMERSSSDIPRESSSLINFLKEDADLDTPPELQEMALTSVKGSGKQKGRASFFSACICCSAATH